MKPKVGMPVEFNPHGTDERWYGEITAVHSESTVDALLLNGDDYGVEKPDIHFCAPGEACEVSMCKALSDNNGKKPKGKPTVDEIELFIDEKKEALNSKQTESGKNGK